MKNYIKIVLASLAIVLVAVLGVVLYSAFNGVFKINKYDTTLIINEYQLKNENTIKNSKWDSPDWIELYNYGEEDIWLGDKFLSDDSGNLHKCKLPGIVVGAGEYVLVYASSVNEQIAGEVHIDFKLSENDGEIFLSEFDSVIDTRSIDAIGKDISAGYNLEGKWVYFATPTPGNVNDTAGSKNAEIQPVYLEVPTILINEYMSSNKFTIKDEFGKSPDWIELYNPNENTVNLRDYYISDDEINRGKYRLPYYELKPNEYIVLYASGEVDENQQNIHLPFSIGKSDLSLIISSYTGSEVDKCSLDPLPADISAGRGEDGSWTYFYTATPNEQNSLETSSDYNIAMERISDSPIIINEVMPNNQYGLLDAEGDSSDWIEIHNPTEYDISLSGYALSDDALEPDKWLLPEDAVVEANGYLIIFVSNKDNTIDGEMHADFALGASDDAIFLFDELGAAVSSVELEDMPGNVSKGRLTDGSYGYFPLPTPGEKNTGTYVDELKADDDFLLTDIYISEVAAGQARYNHRGDIPFREYIEIYNAGEQTVNLSGYTIADAGNTPWVFPDVYIQPNKYITLQLKGSAQETTKIINADLSLDSSGENIVLKNSDGVIIDCFETGYLTSGVSSGRVLGMGSSRYFFGEITPNKKNSSQVLKTYCDSPVFSHEGGMVADESILLEIDCTEGQTIRYTTNGKAPDATSKIYTQPISLTRDTVIKAACFAEGLVTSAAVARTYIFQREHDIPIVCLSTNPVYLISDSSGIFANGPYYVENEPPYIGANFWNDWEPKTSFEYYDENNHLELSFEAGMQVAGQYSRLYEQKSVVIRLRDEYGLDEVYYPFFEDYDVNEFSHILLRNSGQDLGVTKIRDFFIHQSVKGYTDIDIMDGKSVAVYINGEYWGLYNLREKQNEDYLASHHGVDPDDVTIVKSDKAVIAGDKAEWFDLRDFIEGKDFSDDSEYVQLCEMVDADAFMDYIIIQSFYGNYDIGNIKYWKSEGGKWRPMLFDTDMALIEENSHINYIDVYFRTSNYSVIFNALFQNQDFKDAFVQRYAYFINEVFAEQRLIDLIDELSEKIDKEIVYQAQKYRAPNSYERWTQNVDKMKELVVARRNLSVEHLKGIFELSDDEISDLFPWY